MAIKFLLMINKQGTPRISQFYDTSLDTRERRRLQHDVFQTVVNRGKDLANFVCDQRDDWRIVYRRYVGLYVLLGIDANDSELLALETIHLIVEILDQYFGTVRELDVIFHFHAVYAILDEVILAGHVKETNKHVILSRIKRMPQLASK